MNTLQVCGILLLFLLLQQQTIAQHKEYHSGNSQTALSEDFRKTKPVVSKKTEGFLIKAWLRNTDHSQYEVKVIIASVKTKKIITDGDVWFHIVYPGRKNLMPKLKQTNDYHEGIVDLSEKGTYKMMVHLNIGDKHPAITFSYEIH